MADQDRYVLGFLTPQDRGHLQPWPSPGSWNMWPTPSPEGTRLALSSDARHGRLDLWAMPLRVDAEPLLLVPCADDTGSKYAIRPDWTTKSHKK